MVQPFFSYLLYSIVCFIYSDTIKQIRNRLCHRTTLELDGFRRPNLAQIEVELCVSDLGGLFFYLTTGWPRSDVVVSYTSKTNFE